MKHYWRDLPGPNWFSGANIYGRYVDSVKGPSLAVELGAWKGRSTSCMGVEVASSGKAIEFHTIDHWRGTPGEPDIDIDPDRQADRLFEIFSRNIAPVAEHVNVIRSDTAAAAARFDGESIDFLYVDASHTYEGVIRDLTAWYPKVKTGGLIAGDDWCFMTGREPSVRLAVTDFFGESSRRIAIEPGSPPNEDWLQWSIVKRPGLRVAPRHLLALRRIHRALMRSLPVRAARRLLKR